VVTENILLLLIDIIQEFQLESMLPTGTVTYDKNNCQSCIDLGYATTDIVDRIITYRVDKEIDYNSDHLPITIRLDMMTQEQPPRKVRNWATIDEKKLQATLEGELPRARRPGSRPALDRYTEEVVAAIQTSISRSTPLLNYSARARTG
jgi:hypothetical protein